MMIPLVLICIFLICSNTREIGHTCICLFFSFFFWDIYSWMYLNFHVVCLYQHYGAHPGFLLADRRYVSPCVLLFVRVWVCGGCLMTGPITYLFSGFWVTLMYSANFRRVWVDGFPKQAIWYILFIDSALASREQSWEAFRLYMSALFEEIRSFLIQKVAHTLWWL